MAEADGEDVEDERGDGPALCSVDLKLKLEKSACAENQKFRPPFKPCDV